MCEAMRRLMQDEIADEVRAAQRDGVAQGEMKKARETAITLAGMGMPVEKLLGELKEAYPVVPTSDANVSLEELNDNASDAQDAYEIALEEYNLVKDDA